MSLLCFDTLAGAKYPEIVAKIPKKYGIGVFWDTFGLAKNLIAKEAASGRVLIRVQGQWSDTHTFNSGNETKAIQIGKELQRIAAANPKCRIEYSPYCEHRKSAAYMLPLLDKIKLHCPKITLVNCPISGGEYVRGYKNEIHNGNKPRGMPQGEFNFSFDGLHCVDSNFEQWKRDYSGADTFFVWVYQFNLLRNGKKPRPPRPTRKCKPTEELIKSLAFIYENQKAAVKLNAGWISKSHSEQHKDVDPSANKLVLVGPKGKKFNKVNIGPHSLRDGGLTEDKRNTWRSPSWAYKLGRNLKVVADGKLVGTVDPAWRENEYRDKGE